MARKVSPSLGLSSIASPIGGTETALVATGANGAFSRELQRMTDEAAKHELAMAVQRRKTTIAGYHLAVIHQQAAATFDETIGVIVAPGESAGDGPAAHFRAEFANHQAAMYARHVSGIVETGAASIALELSRSPYPPPEPKPGFWSQLLFGGR